MHHRFAAGPWMIVLVVASLLASRAGLGGSLPPEAYAAVSPFASAGERSVERVHGNTSERDGVRRSVFVRATAPAVSRVQAPSGTAGTDAPRTFGALGVQSSRLELVTRHAAGQGVDERRRHIPSPEQPALSSRAPPTA